jgi:hypothetical protein
MGGTLAIRAAATFPDRIAAATAFHAGHVVTDGPVSPHLLAKNIKAKVLVAGADQDPYFTEEQFETLKAAMKDLDAEVTIYRGALHGYAPNDLPVYDVEHSERHWREMLALFDGTLKTPAAALGRMLPLRGSISTTKRPPLRAAFPERQCVRRLGGRLRGELGLHLALDLQGARRQGFVAGLQQEGVQAATGVERAQRRVADAQGERLAERIGLQGDRGQRRQEAALGLDIRVAHIVADHRADTREFATARHGESTFA